VTINKQIVLVRRRDDVDESTFARGLIEYGSLVAQHQDAVVKVAVNIVQTDQKLFEIIGLRVRPIDWHGLVHAWFDAPRPAAPAWRYPHSEQALADLVLSIASESSGWWVDENEAWPYDRDWPDGVSTPGIKQMSLVARRPDITFDEFVTRYRSHVNVAKLHHIGCWQYVQNFIAQPIGTRPAPAIDGISELWFRSVDDMVERFYTAPGSPDAVRDDTSGFIDFANTRSYLSVETIVFSR
jgi:hypothetical protein